MIYRKIFHSSSILLIIPVIFLDDHFRIAFSILFLIVVFLIDTLRQKSVGFREIFMMFFRNILKKNEFFEYTSATYLAISYAIINILFEKEIVIFSMLVLAICDPIAAIFGNYIKPNILIYKKSINGLLGFYISGIILSIILFPQISMFSKIIAIIITGIVELFTPIDDNLAIPITSSLILKYVG